MLIALLAILGVDLIVIVLLLAALLARRRWVKHRMGAFAGMIRVKSGDLDGLGPSWKRGYGRWVHDVLVWTKGPLNLRNVLLPTDHLPITNGPQPSATPRFPRAHAQARAPLYLGPVPCAACKRFYAASR